MWKFDLKIEKWEPISYQSTILPTPRSDFAYVRNQDSFIMFGGLSDAGLLNDLHTFNLKTNEWEMMEIRTVISPTPRSGSCLVSNYEYIFIFGGNTGSSYSNELWKFNKSTRVYELVITKNEGPPPSAFSNCYLTTNAQQEILFQVYMGEKNGGSPTSFFYQYNLSANQWTRIRDITEGSDKIARSKTAAYKILDKLVIAGGVKRDSESHSDINILDVRTGRITYLGNLPSHTFYGASMYYKDKIYIHGGAYSFGNLPLKDIAKHDFVVIDLDSNCETEKTTCISGCSKGAYFYEGDCRVCPPGTYSDIDGSDFCNPCPSGFYSDIRGGDSIRVCKRCPYDYYSIGTGQSRCMDCPTNSICLFDQIMVDDKSALSDYYKSVQPELLDDNEETADTYSLLFSILLCVLFILFLPTLLLFSKSRKQITDLDLYILFHNYKYDSVMYPRKTLKGGIFSVIFLFIVIYILFDRTIYYTFNNVLETKALVPSIALDQKYGTVSYI
jgi:hypothetical protein